jgi:hypothetical protein
VAKAYNTIWIDGLLYKLTVLNLPSYLVHTISSYLQGWTFEASFLMAMSSCHVMRAGVAQGGLISPVLFSLCVKDMPTPSHHVELAFYVDDTVHFTSVSHLSSQLSLPLSLSTLRSRNSLCPGIHSLTGPRVGCCMLR